WIWLRISLLQPVCPFLQSSVPSLQWLEKRAATLMKRVRFIGGVRSGLVRPQKEIERVATSGVNDTLQDSLLHFFLGSRPMRILSTTLRLAFLISLALVSAASPASTFSGGSADITDFAGGSEVSTAGTYISAVNLLNDNVSGVGVSTTINGV